MEEGDTGLLKRYSLVWHGGIVIRLMGAMGLGVSVSSMINIVDMDWQRQGLVNYWLLLRLEVRYFDMAHR